MSGDGNVIEFTPTSKSLDIPVGDVLAGAVQSNLDEVLVIGYNEDGDLYIHQSTNKAGELLLLMELAKTTIMDDMMGGR